MVNMYAHSIVSVTQCHRNWFQHLDIYVKPYAVLVLANSQQMPIKSNLSSNLVKHFSYITHTKEYRPNILDAILQVPYFKPEN